MFAAGYRGCMSNHAPFLFVKLNKRYENETQYIACAVPDRIVERICPDKRFVNDLGSTPKHEHDHDELHVLEPEQHGNNHRHYYRND